MDTNRQHAQPDRGSIGAGGFTLIELMVTVLVVAILAAIAIPSYSHYTLKAHRTEAKSALLDLASLEERYFSVNNTYSNTPSDMGYAGTTAFSDGSTTVTVGSGYYQITQWDVTAAAVPTATAPGGTPAQYIISVTATGNQLNDTECNKFTINQQGQQTSLNSSGTATTDCW